MSFDMWSQLINLRELDEITSSQAFSVELSMLMPKKEGVSKLPFNQFTGKI